MFSKASLATVTIHSKWTFTHLVHVKCAEHLLDVGIGLLIQASEPEELFELMQRELTRWTLSHELLIPQMHFNGLQVVHGAARWIPHHSTENWLFWRARLELLCQKSQLVCCAGECFASHRHTTLGSKREVGTLTRFLYWPGIRHAPPTPSYWY